MNYSPNQFQKGWGCRVIKYPTKLIQPFLRLLVNYEIEILNRLFKPKRITSFMPTFHQT